MAVIEAQSLNAPAVWEERVDPNTGRTFIRNTAPNALNAPGTQGLITFEVFVNEPGTYRLQWLSQVGAGDNPTDHNDSWLRIHADSFYAGRNGSVKCPADPLQPNDCQGPVVNGSTSDGWFKVYRSGGTPGDWNWRTSTSDNDGHDILARFDNPGNYTIEISGRSQSHGIDRIVLHRSDIANSTVQDLTLPQSSRATN